MKYIVNLNGKNYEVEVEEDSAAVLSVTDAPEAQPAAAPAAPAAHVGFNENGNNYPPFC